MSGLTMKQLVSLSEISDVPVPTLYKIKNGTTTDPGIKTLGAFWPHLSRLNKQRSKVSA